MKRKIIKSKRARENIEGYLYLFPMLILIVFIFFYPIFQNIRYSFLDLAQKGAPFVGLRNYRIVFTDNLFYTSIKNNFLLFLLIPVLVFVCLIFSVLLYEKIRGWKFYRTIIFLPYVLAIAVIGIFFSYFFQGRGVLNTILRGIGLDFLAVDWLGSSRYALLTIMIIIIWHQLGYGVVLFLARLMSVPGDIYDAADIDGVNWFQRLWYITIPQLATVIEFYVFLLLITMLSWVFNYIYVITFGGPGQSTYVSEFYIYIQAFKFNSIGVSAVVTVVLLVISGLIGLFFSRVRKRIYSEYE